MTPEQFEQKLRQNREALKQAIRRTIRAGETHGDIRRLAHNLQCPVGGHFPTCFSHIPII